MAALPTKSVLPAASSLVTTTMTEELLSRSGGEIGFSGECLGLARGFHVLLVGTLKPNCEIFAENADFLAAEATPRVFWSGGDAARDAAAAWAKANGATTLEMTQTGQELDQTTKGLDWLTQGRPAWADASRNFAQGAAGDVHVFQSGSRGVSLQSIWRDTEYPTLMQNNNVNNIIYHVIP